MFKKLTEQIEHIIACKGGVLVAIDGKCGSGKTTLASFLVQKYGGRVVHLDHFFLPPELRNAARLSMPGGNFHKERFLKELAPTLSSPRVFEQSVCYNAYSCQSGKLCEVSLPPAPLTIVEGSYSLHPDLQYLYDIKVFCTVSDDEQARRIKMREGKNPQKEALFFSRWIPLENRYFEAFNLPESCDFILDMESFICSL